MMNEELKPCPWCGSADVTPDNADADGILCNGCGFYWSFDGYEYSDRVDTISRWNTRPLEDALNDAIAGLRVEFTQQNELRRMEAEALAGVNKEVERRLRARIAELEAKQKFKPVKGSDEWFNCPTCGFLIHKRRENT